MLYCNVFVTLQGIILQAQSIFWRISDKKSKIGSKVDGDELQSPFEYDEPTPRKGYVRTQASIQCLMLFS